MSKPLPYDSSIIPTCTDPYRPPQPHWQSFLGGISLKLAADGVVRDGGLKELTTQLDAWVRTGTRMIAPGEKWVTAYFLPTMGDIVRAKWGKRWLNGLYRVDAGGLWFERKRRGWSDVTLRWADLLFALGRSTEDLALLLDSCSSVTYSMVVDGDGHYHGPERQMARAALRKFAKGK